MTTRLLSVRHLGNLDDDAKREYSCVIGESEGDGNSIAEGVIMTFVELAERVEPRWKRRATIGRR